jgi:hypothetical protein
LEFRHHARWGKHEYISFGTGRSSNPSSAPATASAGDQRAFPQALREDASGKNVDAILGPANLPSDYHGRSHSTERLKESSNAKSTIRNKSKPQI